MCEDEIMQETRRAKREFAAQFNGDLEAMCEYLRERQKRHGGRLVSYGPKRIEPNDREQNLRQAS